jgi:hypothetical protein
VRGDRYLPVPARRFCSHERFGPPLTPSGQPRSAMSNMTTIEAKAFVPAQDFDLSKRFYQDLGFELAWSSEDLAYLRRGNSSFLLQKILRQGERL